LQLLERYLTHVALFTNTDTAASLNKVKLMTVHAAKGLEFPYVFLCSLSEGVFPAKWSGGRSCTLIGYDVGRDVDPSKLYQ
jgi:superfamily I DNA/RNA helicase